jgi:hypothetical protein
MLKRSVHIHQLIGVTHVAVQFPLYEHLKHRFARQHAGVNNSMKEWKVIVLLILNEGRSVDELSAWELMAASALSKITASVAAYPHEVLRSRLQHQHNSDPHRYISLRSATCFVLADAFIHSFIHSFVGWLIH